MSDEKPKGLTGTVAGWVKTLIGSLVGLASGVVIMFLTPVVNNAIKPPKPVANFAVSSAGLNAEIANRSTGGVQGWWDFGDGSALEPFDPKIEKVMHSYSKPGSYMVKLSLQNSLGEENDRSASVSIDAGTAPKPDIDTFKLISVSPNDAAPATYRLLAGVKNASYSMLCFGDDRPMEVIDGAGAQERYITFNEMGMYTVRLAAVNGKQVVEKTETVYVGGNDGRSLTARLQVTYSAVRVQRMARELRIPCVWQGDTKETVSAFRRERSVEPGSKIVSAELLNKDDKAMSARNIKLELAADKSKVIVTGELVRPTGILAPKMAAAPSWVAQLKVVTENRGREEKINRGEVAMAVNINTTTKIPLQPLGDGYELAKKDVKLELWDGSRKVWETGQSVTRASATLKNQSCFVTMALQNDACMLTIDSPTLTGGLPSTPLTPPPTTKAGPLIRPAGFEKNPLLPGRP